MTTRASLRKDGEAMRHRLFGDDDGAPAILRTLNGEAVYGAIWSRPGLALEDRMVCALAALGAVQRLKKLRRHVAAALDLGLSARAIVEILIQLGAVGLKTTAHIPNRGGSEPGARSKRCGAVVGHAEQPNSAVLGSPLCPHVDRTIGVKQSAVKQSAVKQVGH